MSHSPLRRTLLLRLVFAAAALLAPGRSRAVDDPAVAGVRGFYDALLDSMKHARQLGLPGRYDRLAPVVRATFDLAAMTRIAVGQSWTTIASDQQTALIDNFTRMTIATYANRFDGYAGERFEVDPTAEARGLNRIVRTRLIESNGNATQLNYLTHEAGSTWKVVDVYLSGTVSELATRRSEFGSILKSGGVDGLIDSLRQRADKLMR